MLYDSPHFCVETDDDVLSLWIDFRDRPSHTVTLPILSELSLVLERIRSLRPAAILIRSRNSKSFLEELDVRELCRMQSPLEFAALARRGQDVTRKLRELSAPTVALIEGRCAGFGLEFALACSIRVAVASPRTRMEFTDLSRGLVPFCGGSHRLRSLLGVRKAIDLWSGSRSLDADQASTIGLTDRAIAKERLAIELITLVDRLRDEPTFRLRRTSMVRRFVERIVGPRRLRNLVNASPALREFAACLTCRSEEEAMIAERAAIARLADETITKRCLDAARQAEMPLRVVPAVTVANAKLPGRIGIVGAGPHGLEIAKRLANRGHEIVLQTRALSGARRDMPNGIRTTTDWLGFDRAEFVVEAVSEDPGEKRNAIHEIEQRVGLRTIVASATSTLLVENLQAESSRPQRIVGWHLPNLSSTKPIAEIVGTRLTQGECTMAIADWSREWGFTPFVVADRPGRLIDVVRHAYLSEAVTLVAEGVPIQKIDAACRKFGMSRGPLEWCDELGFERLAELTAHLQMARDDGFARNLLFQRLLPYGCVGKAVGEGFYRYGLMRRPNEVARMLLWQDFDDDGHAGYVFDPEISLREGIERVLLRAVNEAASALADEPDANPATVDLAISYGMGWPLQRGGPLRYADELGIGLVVDRLAEFAERFGRRFTPCDELVRRAEAGESFYADEVPVGGKVLAWRVAV